MFEYLELSRRTDPRSSISGVSSFPRNNNNIIPYETGNSKKAWQHASCSVWMQISVYKDHTELTLMIGLRIWDSFGAFFFAYHISVGLTRWLQLWCFPKRQALVVCFYVYFLLLLCCMRVTHLLMARERLRRSLRSAKHFRREHFHFHGRRTRKTATATTAATASTYDNQQTRAQWRHRREAVWSSLRRLDRPRRGQGVTLHCM